MISSEVQRTLVKSPPELWAELSDPAALARHLGELGEIRIVRVKPETTVEWAAENNTTGTVSIKPSGWGTKVTLRVERELDETTGPEPEPAAVSELEPEAEPATVSGRELETEAVSELAPEPVPTDDTSHGRRRGFFARLFGRRSKAQSPPTQSEPATADAFAAVREVLTPETVGAANAFTAPAELSPASTPPTEWTAVSEHTSARDIAAELLAAEEVAAEEVTAVLTAMLDRLGAAHHRPFSRA
ncbi:MAG TPA: hypothetical protein VK272_08580 [Solirubrobacteraceae bacterium]|nr:hypothetical protein [Solirubrobacteraceae bacterium]